MLHSFWEPGPNHTEKASVSSQPQGQIGSDPNHTPGGPQIASDLGARPRHALRDSRAKGAQPQAAEPELGGRLPHPSSRSAAFPGREEGPKRVTGSLTT